MALVLREAPWNERAWRLWKCQAGLGSQLWSTLELRFQDIRQQIKAKK